MTIAARITITALAIAAALGAALPAAAQRRITPVTPVRKVSPVRPARPDSTRLAERLDAQGRKLLVDTVTGEEWVDTTAVTRPGNIYPLLQAVTVGVDVWDPLMRIFGQHYGGIGFWGELSLHNRFNPVVEFGLSKADLTPDGSNFTFRSPMAPYFKLGMNYNVFYNSDPAYQLLVGLRYGFSPFRWQVTDVTLLNDYWGQEPPIEFPSQSTSAGYFEFVVSIKVRIVRHISLGWAVKYHSVIHGGRTPLGEAMIIPGFGNRNNALTGGFSIMYTLPLNKAPLPAVDKE